MAANDDAARTRRLLEHLAPLHDRARMTARRLCRSNADGDDLFQETVIRALDRFGELRDEGRFRSWFYAVMLSVHRARHRRAFWRRFSPLDDRVEEPSHPAEADALEGADRMARALGSLPPEGRETIVLFELEGFSLEEIAALQSVSLSAVKSRLARARSRLARYYETHERVAPHLTTERRHEPG
jgi:RNA polymerase sigma-70 factor (ECF subfamily)